MSSPSCVDSRSREARISGKGCIARRYPPLGPNIRFGGPNTGSTPARVPAGGPCRLEPPQGGHPSGMGMASGRHLPTARHATRPGWRRWAAVSMVTLAVLLLGGSLTAFVAYRQLNGNITRISVDDRLGKDRPVAE